ncbi:MAG TPA: MFS transporter [Anaerolineaceae bacterium]|jgi:MFS family permease
MSQAANQSPTRPHFIRSLISVILGSLILRAAAGAMGQNIQFYFNAINEAALNPNHPLRAIVGSGNVYQISYTLGGLIIGSFFAAELLGSLLLGAWSDRYGRKLFIIFGPLFGAAAVLITSITTWVWLLIFTRLLEGLSTASNAPATLGYIAEETSNSPKLRTRIVGLFEVATVGGMALGFSLGGWLWRTFGTSAIVLGIPMTSPAFAINAVFYLASLFILWLGIHEVREKKKSAQPVVSPLETIKHYWAIASSPRVANFAPAWIAINAVLGIWINLTARILTDKTSYPNQLLVGRFDSLQAGNILAGYAIFFVLGILIWSVFFTHLKKTTVMLIGVGGLFGSSILIAAMNHQPSLNSPLFMPLSVLLVICIMVQSGFTPSALAHLADITESHVSDRGAIMGLYSVFLGLGQFIGSSIGGPFVDWLGADGMVLATSLMGVIAAVMLIRLPRIEAHSPPA